MEINEHKESSAFFNEGNFNEEMLPAFVNTDS